ncbi:MAG: lysostaphin resistance A-like protein [Microcystaceae cyanobacterium]
MSANWSKIARYPAPLRLGIFIGILLLLWLPIAATIYLIFRSDANLVTILVMAALFIEFLVWLNLWSRRAYNNRQGLGFYGLAWTKQNAFLGLKGLGIGLGFTFSLFITESLFGWVTFQGSQTNLAQIILEGSVTAIGVAFAEELFFRGWLLTELERDYAPINALWVNGLIFALLHFLKPVSEIIRTFPQFPALFLLGITLILAKRSHQQKLGICIGLHGGLVWGYYILNVGKLVTYTNQVPSWVTGIDNNPLAGLMGILFLSLLTIWMINQPTIKRQ